MRKFEFKHRHTATIRDVAGNNSIAVTTRDVVKGARIEKRSVVFVDDREMVLLKLALPAEVKPIGGWPNLTT
ncbi:hypothetical protein WJ41_35135 [Burkholderia ubonensis]|uniref:hypothetical protein n=1 Tax=Burkholderia ubonensis TaxID=101571 RepID=UPI00075CEC39|nr:hypothetical protein [Burkholderia ubonensis]KVH78746.1 hypothetical protein WJ41_35135 [Burkholderia ubonensis]KVT98637.1 hypothetical protein WK61_09410 [Burkholderia ubonensis]